MTRRRCCYLKKRPGALHYSHFADELDMEGTLSTVSACIHTLPYELRHHTQSKGSSQRPRKMACMVSSLPYENRFKKKMWKRANSHYFHYRLHAIQMGSWRRGVGGGFPNA